MKIKLKNCDLFFEVSDEDFEKLNQFEWFFYGKAVHRRARTRSKFRYSRFKEIKITVAQEIFQTELMYDHIDTNVLNNKRDNLRDCSYSQNNANRKRPANCSSIYRGVYKNNFDNGRSWNSNISVHGKMKNLGRFDDEIHAALVYDNAAIQKFGKFARLNFPIKLKF